MANKAGLDEDFLKWIKQKDKIDEYIDIVRKMIDIDTVIIFGSFFNPDFNAENSDIDILIVSDDFKNMSKLDAYKILSDPLWESGFINTFSSSIA